MSTFTVPHHINTSDTTVEAQPVSTSAETPQEQRTIGQVLWIGVPLTMVAVFAVTAILFLIGGTPLGESVGYGVYLAFWIGGGFGMMISGAYFNHVNHGVG